MGKRKSWSEKMENGHQPKIVRLEKAFAGNPAGTDMLVSTPREVDSLLKKIPHGKFLSVLDLRRKLASKHGADFTCPLSTGIFVRIASEAAWEQIQQGSDPSEVTPFWRTVATGSAIAGKLACGEAFLRKMQRQEGIE